MSVMREGVKINDDGSLNVTFASGSTVDSPTFTGTLGASGVILSGTYTPTLTGVANVASFSAFACQYLRVGTVVTVSGHINITATANGLATQLGITLPIASNFTTGDQLAGTACPVALAGLAGGIGPDTTNDRAQLQFTNGTDTSSRAWYFTFTYVIV